MGKFHRVFVIVLDSLGVGAMPDSGKFGDVGVDTFGHIVDTVGPLQMPNLTKLGFLQIHPGKFRCIRYFHFIPSFINSHQEHFLRQK